MRFRVAIACLCLAVAAVAPRAQQTAAPIFRSGTNLIEVDALVTDKSGAIVHGLTQDDFQVAEDGQPQELTQFSFVDLPMPSATTPAAVPAAPTGVASNVNPAGRRLYAIVLDALHVDSMRSTVVRDLAKQFIEEDLGPNDLAAVVIVGRATANQPFTSDKALLEAAVSQFIGKKSLPATVNKAQQALIRSDIPAEDVESETRANDARVALETLSQLCARFGETNGYRRAVVLFAEGVDFDTTDLIGQDQRLSAGSQGLMHEPAKKADAVIQAELDLYAAARRANVSLYTVDPRGNTMGEDYQMFGPSGIDTKAMLQEVRRGQGALRTFASETGGLSVVGTNNITAGFTHIVQANSAYYVLGYTSTNPSLDGKYRKISVKVKGHDVDVTFRQGYYAPAASGAAPPAASLSPLATPDAGKDAPSAKLRGLLANELPGGALQIHVTGGPIAQGDRVRLAIVAEIDARTLPFAETDGKLSNDIEIAFVAVDALGKVQASDRSVGHLKIDAADRASLGDRLRYVDEFPVAPGRYQIRVAAHEAVGDTGGSAILDVNAVDASKLPLSMGALLVTTDDAQSVPTSGSATVLKSLLPSPPTARREFSNQETLVAFVNVCDTDSSPTGQVTLDTVVRDAGGREAFREAAATAGIDLSPRKGGSGYVTRIPLTGLAPGSYALTIGARTSGGQTASQSLEFAVR